MGLKAEVDDISTVEAPFRPLYTEKDGKHVLTGVEDMVPKKDLAAVKTEAGGYRISLKKAEDKLKAFGDLDPVKVHDDLARIPELEALATGKIDDKKINDIVEQRITAKIAPVQRAHDLLKTENADRKSVV